MDAEGKEKSFFSERVPDDIMQRLLLKSKNPIFELELFPILLSVLVRSKEMNNRPVIFYIDNEGAKAALVSASSSTQAGSEIIEAFVRKEFELSLCGLLVCPPRVIRRIPRRDFSAASFSPGASPRSSVTGGRRLKPLGGARGG